MIIIKLFYPKLLCVTLLIALVNHTWCQPVTRPPKIFYVSTNGNDDNSGTSPFTAFRNIQTGVDSLKVPGDVLRIIKGKYTEFVTVRQKKGTSLKPIIIEGWPGLIPLTPVTILQGSITAIDGTNDTAYFHLAPNNEWEHAAGVGVHPQEYVSKKTFPKPAGRGSWFVSRGAFIDTINGRYTRLITYSKLEDLRAINQTSELILEGSNPGCSLPDPARPGFYLGDSMGCRKIRPWVYMGPGIWFDNATEKIHIRLSPTNNAITGLADYTGNTNPNQIALSIAEEEMTTLIVQGSSYLQIRNLSVRFSGKSIEIIKSRSITFDNVTVWAGEYGAKSEDSTKRLRFSNTVFDGGLPTWMFRSDLKNDYKFLQGADTFRNNVGKSTMETLFLGSAKSDSTEIDHCEFINAHDLYLGGKNFNFHHNWINNLHDEGLFLDAGKDISGRVHNNVITQVLSAISFAGGDTARHWYIYRNLVDLRKPTAGYRPKHTGFDKDSVWRGGMPFKSNGIDGPFDVFQNTFIVPFRKTETNDHPFSQLQTNHLSIFPRRSFNNIFVIVNHYTDKDMGMAYLPQRTFPAVIKNNLYYIKGFGVNMFYMSLGGGSNETFKCDGVIDCYGKWKTKEYFTTTKFEENSLFLRDPKFRSWSTEPANTDDFRLKPGSPAIRAGEYLPADLKLLDPPLILVKPDIGCYQSGLGAGLQVGVRGRKHYPGN